MATLLAHIRVVEGGEARFEAIARSLYDTSQRTETALVRYEYWRATEPRSYYALLAFDDFRGFIAHQTSPHHETASPDLGQVIESIRLEWLDPVQGASPLPVTAMQEPLPDADPLSQKYSKRFAAQIADWWLALR
jgi:quinol monooxygenase YgiN